MKYAFVRANCEQFRIGRMCQVLQVSRSGYYDWAEREESERSRRDRVLLKEIRKIHQETKKLMGHTRFGVFKICVYELMKQDLVVESEDGLNMTVSLENDRAYIGATERKLYLI